MKSSPSFNEWIKKAYRVLYNNVDESSLDWSQVFDDDVTIGVNQMALFNFNVQDLEEVPREQVEKLKGLKSFEDFKRLIDSVLCHNSPEKFGLCYQLLKKFSANPTVLKNPADEDIRRANILKKQVGRDIHKMRAFVRFNEAVKDGEEYYIAYHKPDHFILKKNANFFKDRFQNMKWAIFTPYAVLAWNQEKLFYKEGAFSPKSFPHDPFVNLWKTYFVNIFNPARLKVKAMKNEMPVRYWENMPETELIPELIRTASSRVSKMKRTLDSRRPPAETYLEGSLSIEELNTKLKECKSCSLCELKNNVVSGEGDLSPKVLIVGEAPGDKEDLSGRPFVGPAGTLLKECLEELRHSSADYYLTNSVKHFNFTEKGGNRIHKTPKTEHIMSCRPWLSKEIELLKPDRIICMGRTAIHAVFGFPSQIESMRGDVHKSAYSKKTFVTYHPARILREKSSILREEILIKFKKDLDFAFNQNFDQ